MPIFTIGDRLTYRKAIQKHERILKMKGGYAFGTAREALDEIWRQHKQKAWAIWTVDAEMDKHTQVADNEHYFVLTEDRWILDEYTALDTLKWSRGNGACSIRDSDLSDTSLAQFLYYFSLAKEDFPTLTEQDVRFIHNRGYSSVNVPERMGLEWDVASETPIPPHYKHYLDEE